MRRVLVALAVLLAAAGPAAADDQRDTLLRCLSGSAERHSVPVDALVMIYLNEGGTLGKSSHNTNNTDDLGPFQINDTWLPRLSAHWNVPQAFARDLLLNQFCANVDAAAWILRLNLDAANGDLKEAVGLYHSATPELKNKYLAQMRERFVAILRGKLHG